MASVLPLDPGTTLQLWLWHEEPSHVQRSWVAESLQSVRTELGLTRNGRMRSVLRDGGMWRLLGACSGLLTPGLVKRAKAWGTEL
jgi:hypothetical protein